MIQVDEQHAQGTLHQVVRELRPDSAFTDAALLIRQNQSFHP